jgi:hypothetical protein
MPGYNDADEGSGDSGVIQPGGPSKDAVKKLDQIIQAWQFTFPTTTKSSNANSFLHRTSTPKPP